MPFQLFRRTIEAPVKEMYVLHTSLPFTATSWNGTSQSALTGGYINDRREPQGWRAQYAMVPFRLDAPNVSGISYANGRDSPQGQSRHT